MAVDEVARRNIIGSITPMELNIPVLLLLVKRTNLVPATIVQLAKQSTADLKKPLKVSNVNLGLVKRLCVRESECFTLHNMASQPATPVMHFCRPDAIIIFSLPQ